MIGKLICGYVISVSQTRRHLSLNNPIETFQGLMLWMPLTVQYSNFGNIPSRGSCGQAILQLNDQICSEIERIQNWIEPLPLLVQHIWSLLNRNYWFTLANSLFIRLDLLLLANYTVVCSHHIDKQTNIYVVRKYLQNNGLVRFKLTPLNDYRIN